jgi:hypothetical protein
VHALSGAGASYAAAEAANASPLQAAAQDLAAFSPVKDLTGRPLFGNGDADTANGHAGGNQFANAGGGGGAPGAGGGGGQGALGGPEGSSGQSF